jgi:hypothetical protein
VTIFKNSFSWGHLYHAFCDLRAFDDSYINGKRIAVVTKQIMIMLKYFTHWIVLLSIGIVAAQEATTILERSVFVPSRAELSEFWTAARMRAAEERMIVLPMQNTSISRSLPISNDSPVIVSGVDQDRTSATLKALNRRGRHARTTGRIFWSCGETASSCSGSVIASTSGDLIVTAAHCVYDTETGQWLDTCKWIFVPGYINGTTPYGIWSPRAVALRSS